MYFVRFLLPYQKMRPSLKRTLWSLNSQVFTTMWTLDAEFSIALIFFKFNYYEEVFQSINLCFVLCIMRFSLSWMSWTPRMGRDAFKPWTFALVCIFFRVILVKEFCPKVDHSTVFLNGGNVGITGKLMICMILPVHTEPLKSQISKYTAVKCKLV